MTTRKYHFFKKEGRPNKEESKILDKIMGAISQQLITHSDIKSLTSDYGIASNAEELETLCQLLIGDKSIWDSLLDAPRQHSLKEVKEIVNSQDREVKHATTPLDGMTETKKERVMKYFNALKDLHKTLSYTNHIKMSQFVKSNNLSSTFLKVLVDGNIISTNGQRGKNAKFEWKSIEPTLQMAITLLDKLHAHNQRYTKNKKTDSKETDSIKREIINHHQEIIDRRYYKSDWLMSEMLEKIDNWNQMKEEYDNAPDGQGVAHLYSLLNNLSKEIANEVENSEVQFVFISPHSTYMMSEGVFMQDLSADINLKVAGWDKLYSQVEKLVPTDVEVQKKLYLISLKILTEIKEWVSEKNIEVEEKIPTPTPVELLEADFHSPFMKKNGLSLSDLPDTTRRKIKGWGMFCDRYKHTPDDRLLRSIQTQSVEITEEIEVFSQHLKLNPSLNEKKVLVCKNPTCGIEFEPDSPRQKYCCYACREFYYQNKKNPLEIPEIKNVDVLESEEEENQPMRISHFHVCKNTKCGKEFQGRRNKKFCSDNCKMIYNNDKAYEKRKNKSAKKADIELKADTINEVKERKGFKFKFLWGLISYEKK